MSLQRSKVVVALPSHDTDLESLDINLLDPLSASLLIDVTRERDRNMDQKVPLDQLKFQVTSSTNPSTNAKPLFEDIPAEFSTIRASSSIEVVPSPRSAISYTSLNNVNDTSSTANSESNWQPVHNINHLPQLTKDFSEDPPPSYVSIEEVSEQVRLPISPARFPSVSSYFILNRLSGEETVMNLKNTALQALDGRVCPGELIMTTYKLMFMPRSLTEKGKDNNSYSGNFYEEGFGHLRSGYFMVPLGCIDRIERDRKSSGNKGGISDFGVSISIYTKDLRFLRIILQREVDTERAFAALFSYAFPSQLDLLFAFTHQIKHEKNEKFVFAIATEYDRQGVTLPRIDGSAGPWRITQLNQDYRLCGSYPHLLVVPHAIPDQDLYMISSFRSEGRLPVLSWGRSRDAASIWRSSQPRVGMQQATCVQDEKMLDLLAQVGDGMLRILDCRPRANAMANMAAGYGYEGAASYPTCQLTFMDIGNIHVMRQSLGKIEQLALSPQTADSKWSALVEDTGWLGHVRGLLSASWATAYHAHWDRSPVLVHCSHGWDRTSQVVALAQILLDPYYRTMEGFEILVEKDWLAFGHPFQLRIAHGAARIGSRDDQRSPVFLQFLDCVWQLVNQFPSAFEYNGRYLLCIADHLHSCRFGTFLLDCERERKEARLSERCGSLWTYIELNRAHFLSPFYTWIGPHSGLGDGSITLPKQACRTGYGVLLPSLPALLRKVCLWHDYYLRWSPKPSFSGVPKCLHDALSKEGHFSNGVFLDSISEENSSLDQGHMHDLLMDEYECVSDEMEGWVKLAERRIRTLEQSAATSIAEARQETATLQVELLELQKKLQEAKISTKSTRREVNVTREPHSPDRARSPPKYQHKLGPSLFSEPGQEVPEAGKHLSKGVEVPREISPDGCSEGEYVYLEGKSKNENKILDSETVDVKQYVDPFEGLGLR